ncbi:MAG: four helix bundle protein [Candidatus Sungbacteria bacterium]|nr:four helix bundle protein [Candidatus Sungbacteria bacterium]
MDDFVHLVYKVTKQFPREELYGSTSQLRRASLSIILNYIEGYARKRTLVKINFFETSFGSLQESRYLLEFARKENWLTETEYATTSRIAEEIAAMLWKTIEHLHRDM